ncbi:hypothetical protein I4000191A8_02050 [Clostridia bacterium i40-0019-1A8]
MLEKIMDVLEGTPNKLLSGEWKYIGHTDPYIMNVIKQDFNSTLDYMPEDEYFNFEQEYRFYIETKRIEYIRNYLSNEAVGLEELIEIKRLL